MQQRFGDTRVRVFLMFLFLAVFAFPSLSFAQAGCRNGVLSLGDGTEAIRDLNGCLAYLEDPEQSLTFDQVLALPPGQFNRHDEGVLNFGYTESAYWLKMEINTRDLSGPVDWILELALPLVDDVRLYFVQKGRVVQTRRAGYYDNWEERDLAVPNPTFRLVFQPDIPTTLFLRVTNTNTFRLPITLSPRDSYIAKLSVDEAVRGILLGGILAILAYNLFVAVSVRERSNIYYLLYLVSAVLFSTTEQVHGMQIFDRRPALLSKEYLPFHVILTWFFGLLFARSLLETRERSPGLDRVLVVALYGVVATFVMAMFMPYSVTMEWIVVGTILVICTVVGVSFLSWRYFNPAARAHFFAWAAASAGFGLYGLTLIGFFPLNTFTSFSPQIGLTAQVILLSFALADRIKLVQGEALSWSQKALANLRRYQSLFDNVNEGVFQMSPNRRFITANPAMAELLGYRSNQELLQANPDVLEACIGDEQLRHLVVQQLESKGTIKGVGARYVTRTGEERWATISLHTVYDDEGVPMHLEGTCIDATESQQRLQIEREREHERLEKELARNSAQAKSQFLANMSHEIRTPLAAIIGYGETLLDADLSDRQKRSSAETVVRSGRHLLELVNDILDHSKIDANKLDVDVVPVNLPEMLEEIRAFFDSKAVEKGLDFNIVCEYPLPEIIHTDPTRFRQIIINLCGNALKFTEKGSISLSVRCDPGREILLARVLDTGIGMKPEQIDRLFDPFAQGSSAISRQYGGTGLGLSISRRLAELLGGSIRATSRYGEGSEFEVTISTGSLDNVRFLGDASEFIERRRSMPMVEAPSLTGRILCAEDNELNRGLVSLLVGRTGADLVHVTNGAEALEKVTKETFDLILMDIQMPVMNGRDATLALREAGINTPVIALTANVMTEDLAEYRAAGCNGHLAKPIDKQQFYQTLAHYLQRGPASNDTAVTQYRGRVLVAEENDNNRRMVERALRRSGVEPVLVDTAEEAVRTALADSVHLVLMDEHVAGMGGIEATRLLRQTGFRRPIIAFTDGTQSENDALVHAGCDGVLNKPVDDMHLQTLLDRYLALESPASEDEGLEHLASRFLAGLAERRQSMNEALVDKDLDRLQSESHQLKGTAGAMGYPLLTEQAAVLEQLAKSDAPDWQRIRAGLEKLNDMIARALSGSTHGNRNDTGMNS